MGIPTILGPLSNHHLEMPGSLIVNGEEEVFPQVYSKGPLPWNWKFYFWGQEGAKPSDQSKNALVYS